MLTPDNDMSLSVLEPVHDPMPTRLVVRKARKGDIAVLHDLIGALAAHHGDTVSTNPARLEMDLFGPMPWANAFVAEMGDELVGYALTYPTYRATEGERGMDLHQLYVKPDHRGEGIGNHLLSKVKTFAAASGCSHVTVGAATGNFAAYKYYQGQGFKPRPVTGMRFRSEV